MMFKFSTVTAVCVVLAVLWKPGHSSCSGLSADEHFVTHPEDHEAQEGETVVLTCDYAKFRLWIWEFHQQGGRRISIRNNDTYPNEFGIGGHGELVLPAVQSNHTGYYQCHATPMTTCSVFSDNASLIIISKPSVELDTNNIAVNTTQSAVITGRVTGFPIATVFFYQLFDSGIEMVVNSRLVITQPTDDLRFTISFNDLLASDQGTYVIQANNSIGVSNQHHVTLTVKGPDLPVISLDSSPYMIQRYGARIRPTTCSIQESAHIAENGGQATMRWAGPEYDEQSSTAQLVLDLESFEEGEEGEYVCTASNVRGSAQPVSVYVYAPISLPKPPTLSDEGNDRFLANWTRPVTPKDVPIYEYVVYITRDSGPYQTERTPDTEYTIDTSSFPAGEYEVSVAVVLGDQRSAPTGEGEPMTGTATISVSDSEEDSSLSLLLIVGVVVGGVVILFLVGICIGLYFLCYYYPHRRKLSSQKQSWSKENRLDETDQTMGNSYEPLHIPHSELPPSPSPHGHNGIVPHHYHRHITEIDPKWEFARGNLKLSEVLCESHFTILYKATAEGIRDKPIDVAVKALRDTATEDEARTMIYEMEQLSSLEEHPNLVSMLRVCTVEQPLYMVVEYMCHGDLLGFLRASRGHYGMYTVNPGIRNQQPPNLQLSSRDLLGIGGKVANGMRFLADRKVVHRALCCKNVLVGSGLDIKIYNIGGYDLPDEVRNPLVKWCAPEVLADNNFSTGSDVWAFGVTLWEIVTVGATPYPDVTPTDLFSQLYSGMRMPRPPHCGQDVYDMIMHCWAYNSGDRPHFATIHERLEGLAHSKMSLLDLRNYNETAYSHFDEYPSQATAL